jgi:hypothetical protein
LGFTSQRCQTLEYTAPNGGMTGEWWINTYFQENGSGLMEVLPNLTGGTE